MMIIPMDKTSVPSSPELAERLYKKNIELEGGLRKSAQSDPNTWCQIRENYEAIILEDHDFSEKQEVELALWQLHYKKIEEFRAHVNAANSVAPQGGRIPSQPDRIKKTRYFFKSFLAESTGFYHDLILKIRAKFGLPLGFFSESPESQSILLKNENKSAEIKKGLISCHHCLIYLGDLARYKASYGEGDTVNCDYGTAFSYYTQAASLCPSSGNPHHQLAILASYSGDDLLSVYHYFRSLAAEIPFSTARDNLIIVFEREVISHAPIISRIKLKDVRHLQNRHSFSQLPAKPTLVVRPNGRGRTRGNDSALVKNLNVEESPPKGYELDMHDVLKTFSTRFVRLNGILFTRTSLETFGDIFTSVIDNLLDLLSSGHEEKLNFGTDAADNRLAILRFMAILIFTVHNVKRVTEGLSYAESLQRKLLLQNAFAATFEFAGHIIKRCVQVHSTDSSFLLPAILVFTEWLACHQDIAAGSDIDEKQASARSFFWNQCVSFMNKLMFSGLVSFDVDEDETCFSGMGHYDGGETGNRLALWEDFELRGFLPLVPAQHILDFSRRHSFESDGDNMERKFRVHRILAAGKALTNVVQFDGKSIYFDAHHKRLVVGVKPSVFDDYTHTGLPVEPQSSVINQGSQVESTVNGGMTELKPHRSLDVEEDEEEEEIVFKPTLGRRHPDGNVSKSAAYGIVEPAQISTEDDWTNYVTGVSAPINSIQMPNVMHASSPFHAAAPTISQRPLQNTKAETTNSFMEQEAILSTELKKFNMNGNRLLASHGVPDGLQSSAFQTPFSGQPNVDVINMLTDQPKVMPFGITSDVSVKLPTTSPSTSRKNPVRHLGPPPGFYRVPAKQLQNSSMDSPAKGSGMENSTNRAGHSYKCISTDNTNVLNGPTCFPLPGKQVSTVHTPGASEKKWPNFQLFEGLKAYNEQEVRQTNFHPFVMPEQQQAESRWSGDFYE